MLDDDWIKKNEWILTPEAAKFLLSHHTLGRLKLSAASEAILKKRIGGTSTAVEPERPPDWAQRASGDYDRE